MCSHFVSYSRTSPAPPPKHLRTLHIPSPPLWWRLVRTIDASIVLFERLQYLNQRVGSSRFPIPAARAAGAYELA
jgi:hypothetical protein